MKTSVSVQRRNSRISEEALWEGRVLLKRSSSSSSCYVMTLVTFLTFLQAHIVLMLHSSSSWWAPPVHRVNLSGRRHPGWNMSPPVCLTLVVSAAGVNRCFRITMLQLLYVLYLFWHLMNPLSVRLHAQLSQITAIVRLCYSIRQLQLSEYTCWWENRILVPEHVIPWYARWRCTHFN